MSCARSSESLVMSCVQRTTFYVAPSSQALSEAYDDVHQINNVGEGAFLHVQLLYNIMFFAHKQTSARRVFALSPLICVANLWCQP